MSLPCDCAEELQRRTRVVRVYGGEEGWRGISSCSCNAGHRRSSAFEGSGCCGCSGGHDGSRGHGRGTQIGGRRGKEGVQGRKGRNSVGGEGGGRGGGNGGAEAYDGDRGGNHEGDNNVGVEGGKVDGGGSAIVGESGLLQNIHSWWAKLYDYCGPVGLWNLALAMLLLGYYGKSYYWDAMSGRGYSIGGGRQVGGKIKCAPKARPPCCCTCAERPRILKHRLKWPEEDPCRCRI